MTHWVDEILRPSAAKVTPAGAVPQPPDNTSTIGIALDWIRAAFRFKGKPPTFLDASKLLLSVDAVQKGFALANYPIDLIIQGAGSPQTTFDITRRILGRAAGQPVNDVTSRICGMLIVSSIAAAGSIVVVQVIGPGGGYQLARVVLGAAPAIVSTQAIFTGLPYDTMKIPTGYALQVTVPATLGGEVVTVNTVLALAPAPFSL